MRIPHRLGFGGLAVLAALAAVGCGGTDEPDSTPVRTATPRVTVTPIPTATPTPVVTSTSLVPPVKTGTTTAPPKRRPPAPPPAPAPPPPPPTVYYANCDAVKKAGKAPLRRGQPGYRKGLDRDGDGIACDT